MRTDLGALRRVAQIGCLLFGVHSNPIIAEPLTLQMAMARVVQEHPQRHMFEWRRQAATAARRQAIQRPPLEVALQLENFAGSGGLQGMDAAETTLSLSSTIELGNKPGARIAVADAHAGLVQLEFEAQTLNLLGETTEKFVTALAAQVRMELTREAVVLDQSTLASLQHRARAGAASDADVHRAQVALARTRLSLEQQRAESDIARMRLAALWGAPNNPPTALQGDLFALPNADPFEQLLIRIQNGLTLKVYTQEERLQQLNVRLTRANTGADAHWNLGLRHLAANDEYALVAGVSVPLFSRQRGRGENLQAEARLGEARTQRQQAETELQARLFETYTRREYAAKSAHLLRSQLIPALEQAFRLSRQAFERGRYSYLDLIAAQRELLEARQTSIDSATSALLLGAVLEEMTGAPLSTSSTSPAAHH